MLKKSLLSLAITASVAGLSGCNISSVTDNDKATPEAQVAQDAVEAQVDTNIVSPNFSAFTSDFPLGHDFYFADQASTSSLATTLKDGTAHSGAEGSNSENAVTNAIDDLDGGISTLAPLDITMSGTIDPSTVIAGSTVHLVRLPNASHVSSGELILPGTLTAADVDALNLGTLGPFFVTTKADGTEANDIPFAQAAAINFAEGLVLPESVAALNLYGMNDGIPGNGDGILAMQPAASNDGDDTNDDYEVSVISIDGGTDNVIRISPKTPLAAKSKYIVVITGGIMTPEKVVNGETIAAMAIQASTNYTYITGTEPAFSGAVTGLRLSVDGWEQMAEGILGAAALADGIALTMAYTTVDPETVLKSMAYPGYFDPLLAGVTSPILDLNGDGTPETTPYEHPRSRSTALITDAGGEGVNQIPAASLNAALSPKVLVSQAGIELPQYTATLATSSTGQWEYNDLVAAVVASTGSTVPTDINGDKNVTYRFPFAQEQRKAVVPMLLIEPTTTAKATAIAALDGIEGTTAAVYDSGCVKPANGWETIIVQHGITVDRAAALATASTLVASTCHAVVAMDLPHHGIAPVSSDRNGVAIDNSRLGIAIDNTNANPALTPFAYAVDNIVAADATSLLANLAERHEGLTANALLQPVPMTYGAVGDADSPASGTSGDFFIRLDVFQRTRDNMRQAVMDLLNLNATIASIDVDGDTVADLDAANVHFVGHSLGAIVGTTFVAVNNDATVLAGNTNLNKIQTAVLATPGGALPKLLESSVSFSTSLLPSLAASGLTQGSSSLEAFYATFQATIDTADPANFIQSLAAGNGSATPSMMIEMVGGTAFGADIATTDTSLSDDLLDVGAYLADLVVPNNAIGSVMADGSARPETAENTMAGTDKLIELLGSTNVNTAGANAQAYPVTKYATGTHGTFSSAAPVDAFTEMMTESATFIMSEGTSITVANPAVLQP
jgi:pimeloyl-ACP methyl ester carboxylesterase